MWNVLQFLKEEYPDREEYPKHFLFLQPTSYYRQLFFLSIIRFCKVAATPYSASPQVDTRPQFHCTDSYTSVHVHQPIITKINTVNEVDIQYIYAYMYINSNQAHVLSWSPSCNTYYYSLNSSMLQKTNFKPKIIIIVSESCAQSTLLPFRIFSQPLGNRPTLKIFPA